MSSRTEYPRPQLKRDSYICLNGKWNFTIDSGISLKERGLFEKNNYDRVIEVPFCPESALSGIENKDFMNAVAYQKIFEIGKKEKPILRLNFGACDYETEVYINEKKVGTHKGGYTSFSFEIQDYIIENSSNILTVYVKDDNRTGRQPRGKQCPSYISKVCDYTRTTGIWQTVWMEWVDSVYMESIRITPHALAETVTIEAGLNTWFSGNALVTIKQEGRIVVQKKVKVRGRNIHTEILLRGCYLWSPEDPYLYECEVSLSDKDVMGDRIESYFGMRDVTFDGKTFLLNGKKIFLRMILDQGFYPDGIYTAKTEENLINDIKLSQKAGFNGARLHQKVFEERFLYHCDKMGYLVFAEFPDAGIDKQEEHYLAVAREWTEEMVRDYSHPSIIGWCPLNETAADRSEDFLSALYELTRRIDPFRPVIDASGFTHVITDIYDVHDYEQNVEIFAEHMRNAGTESSWVNVPEKEVYRGQPYFVSEYGGIWWAKESDNRSWGYGNRPENLEEFYKRYEGLTNELLKNPNICGYCYTQLTDVEQEKNGIYTYEREKKFDIEKIAQINKKPAAIENIN